VDKPEQARNGVGHGPTLNIPEEIGEVHLTNTLAFIGFYRRFIRKRSLLTKIKNP
jgi:hypothetical protein